MKKTILALMLILVLPMMILPMGLARQNEFVIHGNDSDMAFEINYSQVTTNPKFGENITYLAQVRAWTIGDFDLFNISAIDFYLPDNATTTVVTDFVIKNISGDAVNGSVFTAGSGLGWASINFTGLATLLNDTTNSSEFNITFKLSEPLSQVKLAVSKAGRAYTETWNITSLASNLSIINASLIVNPIYWHTRIGNPTSLTFNATAIGYAVNFSRLTAYTDLNISGNLLSWSSNVGGGSETLSVVYNGPEVSSSSGSSPSKAPLSIIPATLSAWLQPTGILIIVGSIIIVAVLIWVVVWLAKRK